MFFNVLNFFTIFLKFSIPSRVGTDRNEHFFFLFLSLSQPVLPWNEAIMRFFNFLNFFAIFFGISYSWSGSNWSEICLSTSGGYLDFWDSTKQSWTIIKMSTKYSYQQKIPYPNKIFLWPTKNFMSNKIFHAKKFSNDQPKFVHVRLKKSIPP